MDKENKYYSLIEGLVKKHRKFPGYEAIIEEIIDDVFSHSEVIINSIDNEAVIESYLEKVISTSIITVPKKMNFNTAARHRVITPTPIKRENVSAVTEQTSVVNEKTVEEIAIINEPVAQEPVLQETVQEITPIEDTIAEPTPETVLQENLQPVTETEELGQSLVEEIEQGEGLELSLDNDEQIPELNPEENTNDIMSFSQTFEDEKPNQDLVVKMINSIEDDGMSASVEQNSEHKLSETFEPGEEIVEYSDLANVDSIDVLNEGEVEPDVALAVVSDVEDGVPEITLSEAENDVVLTLEEENEEENLNVAELEEEVIESEADGIELTEVNEQIDAIELNSELETAEELQEDTSDTFFPIQDEENGEVNVLEMISTDDETTESEELPQDSFDMSDGTLDETEEGISEEMVLTPEGEELSLEPDANEELTDTSDSDEFPLEMSLQSDEPDDVAENISESGADIEPIAEVVEQDDIMISDDMTELPEVVDDSMVTPIEEVLPENGDLIQIGGDDTEIGLQGDFDSNIDDGLELNIDTGYEDSMVPADEAPDDIVDSSDGGNGMELSDDYFDNISLVASDGSSVKKEQTFKQIDYSVFDFMPEQFKQSSDTDLITTKLAQLGEARPELHVIPIFEMKYKQHLTIGEIAEKLNTDKDSVITVLNKIIELV